MNNIRPFWTDENKEIVDKRIAEIKRLRKLGLSWREVTDKLFENKDLQYIIPKDNLSENKNIHTLSME